MHILSVFSVKTVSEMVMSEQHNANVCISPWETTVASMENYESRPLYISGKAIVKTSLARCLAALKQQNWLNYNGQAFGRVKKSIAASYCMKYHFDFSLFGCLSY